MRVNALEESLRAQLQEATEKIADQEAALSKERKKTAELESAQRDSRGEIDQLQKDMDDLRNNLAKSNAELHEIKRALAGQSQMKTSLLQFDCCKNPKCSYPDIKMLESGASCIIWYLFTEESLPRNSNAQQQNGIRNWTIKCQLDQQIINAFPLKSILSIS